MSEFIFETFELESDAAKLNLKHSKRSQTTFPTCILHKPLSFKVLTE